MSKKRWKMHSEQERRQAASFFNTGLGWKATASRMNLHNNTVKYWYMIWQAVGEEVLFQVTKKKPTVYTYEQKLGAAQAIVEDGMTYALAMRKFGIKSESPLKRWVRAYYEGGKEALKPRTKGRRPIQKPQVETEIKDASEREKELMEELEYLRTENEYLKKLGALMESGAI